MSDLTASEAERIAGSVLVVGFHGTSLPERLMAELRAGRRAGVILFRRNVEDAGQVCALATALGEGMPRSPVIAVDQEGGRVARLRREVLQLPPMRALGEMRDPSRTEALARCLGADLAALGINLNFAPVCDVDSNPANPVIGDRSFGRTPAIAGAQGAAFARGLQAAGVAACAKHFPGHGDTETDSHLELPVLHHPLERIERVELPPFREVIAAGVACVMTAHVRYEALDPELPATLSPTVLRGWLRQRVAKERGDLVVVSDDLLMKAVSARWPPELAAVMAVEAGCDLLLVCDDEEAQDRCVTALARAAMASRDGARRLRESAERVDRLRERWPSRPLAPTALTPFFARAERTRLEAMLGEGSDRVEGKDPTAR